MAKKTNEFIEMGAEASAIYAGMGTGNMVEMGGTVEWIPLDQVKRNPENPRDERDYPVTREAALSLPLTDMLINNGWLPEKAARIGRDENGIIAQSGNLRISIYAVCPEIWVATQQYIDAKIKKTLDLSKPHVPCVVTNWTTAQCLLHALDSAEGEVAKPRHFYEAYVLRHMGITPASTKGEIFVELWRTAQRIIFEFAPAAVRPGLDFAARLKAANGSLGKIIDTARLAPAEAIDRYLAHAAARSAGEKSDEKVFQSLDKVYKVTQEAKRLKGISGPVTMSDIEKVFEREMALKGHTSATPQAIIDAVAGDWKDAEVAVIFAELVAKKDERRSFTAAEFAEFISPLLTAKARNARAKILASASDEEVTE